MVFRRFSRSRIVKLRVRGFGEALAGDDEGEDEGEDEPPPDGVRGGDCGILPSVVFDFLTLPAFSTPMPSALPLPLPLPTLANLFGSRVVLGSARAVE